MPEPLTKEQLEAIADRAKERLKERNPELAAKVEPRINEILAKRQEKGN